MLQNTHKYFSNSLRLVDLLQKVFCITSSVTVLSALPSLAQVTSNLSPVIISSSTNQLAQATAPPQFIPTDITPFPIINERANFYPGYKFRIFQKLPARLWFDSTTETSQRLDTNVFFTYSHPKADYVFRAMPNLTVGYNILKNTSVYANYFVIKDIFADHTILNFPTTQSLSWGMRHNIQIGEKTNAQFDFQARELWQTTHLHQFDFIPSVNVNRTITPRNVIYGSLLLQMRGANYFVAPTRELDPFYTVGYMHRQGLWSFLANNTFVTNFRSPPFHGSIPQQSNMTMITDIEVNRPVFSHFPSLLAFVRAEPIWNWDSHKAPGISGFDFRLYSGLRLVLNKPAYSGAIDNLRKQIEESEEPEKLEPSADNSTLPIKQSIPINISN